MSSKPIDYTTTLHGQCDNVKTYVKNSVPIVLRLNDHRLSDKYTDVTIVLKIIVNHCVHILQY